LQELTLLAIGIINISTERTIKISSRFHYWMKSLKDEVNEEERGQGAGGKPHK